MYKISNKFSVSMHWICCLLISIVGTVIMTGGYLMFPDQLAIIALAGTLFFVIICIIILNVKVFDFENSGEVILIRNYGILNYVFADRYQKKIELPRNRILKLEIKKTLIKKYLKVKIERFDGTKMLVFFTVPYLSNKDIQLLTKSIDH